MGNVNSFFSRHLYSTKTVFLSSQIICFGILFAQAYISTEYRVAYADASYYLFHLCTDKTFFCPHNRFLAIFIEYLPLIGIYLKVPFQNVCVLFSVNPTFSTFILWLIYLFYTKRWDLSWLLVLVEIIGNCRSYNYLVPEHFGYVMSLFFIMIYDYQLEEKKKMAIIIICISLFCFSAHLYCLLLLAIGFIVSAVTNKRKKPLIHLGIILLGYFAYKMIMPLSGYENGKLDILFHNLRTHYQDLDSAAFRWYFNAHYDHWSQYILPVFLIVVCFYSKRWHILSLAIIASIALFYLNCVYFFDWESNTYMELYGLVIFIALLIFLYFGVKPSFRYPIVGLFAFIVLFYVHLQNIYLYQADYKKRHLYLSDLLSKTEHLHSTKLFTEWRNVDKNTLMFGWAIPYETLLISTSQKKSRTIYIANDTIKVSSLNDTFFVSDIATESISKMKNTYFESLRPSAYFILKDSFIAK